MGDGRPVCKPPGGLTAFRLHPTHDPATREESDPTAELAYALLDFRPGPAQQIGGLAQGTALLQLGLQLASVELRSRLARVELGRFLMVGAIGHGVGDPGGSITHGRPRPLRRERRNSARY